MFAVIKTGGKQYKVQSGDMLRVERLAADAGEKVLFNEVLMLGGDSPVLGSPMVDDAGVQAEVVDQIKGEKVIHFVKRRRKHSSKRTKGHRQKLTLVRIGDIMSSGAGKADFKVAIGTGSVSASVVTAMEERYTMNKIDQAEMAKRVKTGQADAKSTEPKKAAKADTPIEAEKQAEKAEAKAKPAKKAKKADGDDLSKISGIGPVIVGKLNDAGITTFAQIAAWTEADVEKIEEELSFKGRVEREDWIAQAKELSKG